MQQQQSRTSDLPLKSGASLNPRLAVCAEGRCPRDAEETAEFYLLGMLRHKDAAAFEKHFVHCPACAAKLAETDHFVTALRAVLHEANVRTAALGGSCIASA